MARPKKTGTATNGNEEVTQTRTVIRAKTAFDWGELLKKAKESHWRTLLIEIQLRDKLMAGKPKGLDAAKAMLKARNLDDFVATAENVTDPTERQKMAEKVAQDEGVCEFTRRDGIPGIWIPSNNIKAGLKENWSVLGLRNSVRGSRKALAEGMFVRGVEDPDWIYVGEKPDGVDVNVAHTEGPSGPIAAIKRNEYVLRPKIRFHLIIANAESVSEKISDHEISSTMIHFQEHGLGANRSQGYGCFDVISVQEVTGEVDG